MKVLHVIDSGGFYGAEEMLLHLCVGQREQGIEAELLSLGAAFEGEKEIEKKVGNAGIPVHVWRKGVLQSFVAAANLLKDARRQGIDLIHSHGYKGNILFGLMPSSLKKVPVCTTIHGRTSHGAFSRLRIYEALDNIACRMLDSIVVVSPEMANQTPFNKMAEDRLKVIPNGIDRNPPELDEEVLGVIRSLKVKNKIIGSVGRLSPEKGYDNLLKAFAEIKTSHENIKLLIFGEGALKRYLTQLSKRLRIDEDVLFMGYVRHAGAYSAHFDVYVNSSHREGMPVTVLEAFRGGCPVAATPIPASVYLSQTGRRAFLATDMSHKALAKAINNALLEGRGGEKVAQAQEFMLASCTTDKMVCEYVELYGSIAGNRGIVAQGRLAE